MKQKPQIIDSATVQMQTYMNTKRMESTIKHADWYQNDPDNDDRLEKQQCRACFYTTGKLGGAAMTERPCGECRTDMLFGSTATDALCKRCAEKLELCKECGGDIHDRPKRRIER